MQGHTTAWQRLPGSGRRVKQSGSILRANEHMSATFTLDCSKSRSTVVLSRLLLLLTDSLSLLIHAVVVAVVLAVLNSARTASR